MTDIHDPSLDAALDTDEADAVLDQVEATDVLDIASLASGLSVLPAVENSELAGSLFGEIAQQMFQITTPQIADALDAQGLKGLRIGETLVSQKVLTPLQLLEVLAAQLEIPYVEDIDADLIPDELIRDIPISFAKQNKVIPLGRTDDGVIIVACSDPLDTPTHDVLRVLYKAPIEVTVADQKSVIGAINASYDRATALADQAVADLEDGEGTGIDAGIDDEIQDLLDIEGDDEAPIIRLVNSLMSQAVKDGASDIHIEPFEREMSVRFRIDGVLSEVIKPPRRFKDAITSRVKIMSGLNIAEKRLPQDGRIRLKVAGRDIDVRVSTVPTTYGERIVMRLLDRSNALRDLGDIGFSDVNLNVMNQLITKSHGIILVTGPTGSGKTSTLYACLAKINKPELNILTIEDPVEYQLKGVGQVQVQSKIDLTFSSGLRSFCVKIPTSSWSVRFVTARPQKLPSKRR